MKMKTSFPFYLFLWVTFAFLTFLPGSSEGQALSVMTYNIRYANERDAEDRWDLRKTELVHFLLVHSPSFIGVQEAIHNQVTFIDDHLEHYAFVGVGRDDGITGGEYSAIFFDTTHYKVLTSGTFWLSQVPDTISVGWDASMERICTYGLFEAKANHKHLWVFNTHFDHMGRVAREQSAKLIIERIKDLTNPGEPVVLMGDFNAEPDDDPIAILGSYFTDPVRAYALSPGGQGTFNGFKEQFDERRIDYIFSSNLARPLQYNHLMPTRKNGRHLSDHFPVIMVVAF